MKRKIISLCILLLGVAIISYPHIASYLQEKNGSHVSDSHQKVSAKLSEKERESILANAQIYNDNLTGSPVHDPFVAGSGVAMPTNYYQVLNVEGIMATLEIPSINVKLPIYHGTSEATLKKGLGHLEGSTLPIGGAGTHAVITGHTGLSHAKQFTNLVDVEKGEEFYVQVLGETLAYQVDKISVVKPEDTDALKTVADQDLVTLLTCTPYGINSHRLLVQGKRVPYVPANKEKIKLKQTFTDEQVKLIKIAAVTASVMGLIIVGTMIRERRYVKGAGKGESAHEI